MMQPNIIVTIPDKCYISPDPKREFPFPFFFQATCGYLPPGTRLPCKDESVEAVKYPQITISGFERLLGLSKIENFIDNMTKTGSDWMIKKAAAGSDIILKYTGDELEPDFCFRASAERFISDAQSNAAVTLTVTVKNFPGMEDHSYIVSSKLDYIPWAKAITFDVPNPIVPLNSGIEVNYDYDGDNVDKKLYQNGVLTDTARSPYTAVIDRPSLFQLDVFNTSGMVDSTQAFVDVKPPQIHSFKADAGYFSEGGAVGLTWETESVSGCLLEPLDKEKDEVRQGGAVVYPHTAGGADAAVYTLRANGYKDRNPYSVSASLSLLKTQWKKCGPAGGYFSGEVYGSCGGSRLFCHKDKLYCYAHPKIYQSEDGLVWTEFASNTASGAAFNCIAADYFDGKLYAMGKEGEACQKLYSVVFDFEQGSWEYFSASQTCSSQSGGFAFSATVKAYAQVLPGGLMIVERGDKGNWNAGTSIIPVENGQTAISGDYCFYKNTFYAVMLCASGKLNVYDCSEGMQEMLFTAWAGEKDRFVKLTPAGNSLFLVTGSRIMDVKRQELADCFYPAECTEAEEPWIGVDKNGALTGIFPDKNLWVFIK